MRRKNLTAVNILFFLLFFSGVGEAAVFTLETVMGEARLCGKGVIDLSSPDRLAVSFVYPREVQVALQGDAARIFREILAGNRAEIHAGVTAARQEKEPHTIRVDFPHEAYMTLTLEPAEGVARVGGTGSREKELHEKGPRESGSGETGVRETGLYDAAFTEKGRVLPFFLVMTETRAAMFATSLLPLGWVDMHGGKPGKIVRVIPDTDAAIPLNRLAQALAAGGLADYKGQGWAFSCRPFAKEQREGRKE